MSHQDPDVTIAENLEQPRKAKNDMGDFEEHSIPDQIQGARYLANKTVGNKNGSTKKLIGMMFKQLIPPGTA